MDRLDSGSIDHAPRSRRALGGSLRVYAPSEMVKSVALVVLLLLSLRAGLCSPPFLRPTAPSDWLCVPNSTPPISSASHPHSEQRGSCKQCARAFRVGD
ncbi:hypothetical protein KC345_g117 [Hortaea werneckii]|nr:hypothetical protein KC345_g117 [Hortaea werneckii]